MSFQKEGVHTCLSVLGGSCDRYEACQIIHLMGRTDTVVVHDIGHYFGSRRGAKNVGEGTLFGNKANSKRRIGR